MVPVAPVVSPEIWKHTFSSCPMQAGTNSWKLCQIPFKIFQLFFFVNRKFWTDLNRGSAGPAVPCQAVSAPPAESLSLTHLVRSWNEDIHSVKTVNKLFYVCKTCQEFMIVLMLGPWEIQLLPWTLQVFRQRGSWHEDSIGEPLWFGATFVQNVELGRFWRIEWNLVKPTAMYCEIVDCDCQCWFNGQDWNIENLDGVSKNLAFVQKCYTPKAILLPFDDHNFGRIPATGDFRYWVAPSRDTEMSFGSMAQGVDGDWMAEMWLQKLGTNDNKRWIF